MSESGDSKILEELRQVFNRYSDIKNYTSERAKGVSEAIYLDSEDCPRGTEACDPTKETCPDDKDALQPEIYTSAGLRCYSSANMKIVRARSPREKRGQQSDIMMLVEQAGKLVALVQGKLKKVTCGGIQSEDLCGMKDTCSWADGVCKLK